MDFLNIKTLDEAQKILQTIADQEKLDTEVISLWDSLGRFLSDPIYAKVNVPSFDRSTVDGYALRCEEVSGASESIPTLLYRAGEVQMGQCTSIDLKPGQAVYVPTGGSIPSGANAVVMIEHCECLNANTILVKDPVHPGENISYCGDDVQIGDLVLERGKRITPLDVALLSGLGVKEVPVFRQLKVCIISTGDEIVEPTENLANGKINDINGYGLSAFVREDGFILTHRKIIPDQLCLIQQAVEEGLKEADLVLLSGGSSAGERDYTSQVIESLTGGELLVHGLAIKPGKPTMIGRRNHQLIIGLPGHPSAAMLLYQLTVRYYLSCKLQTKFFEPLSLKARLTKRLQSAPGKDSFAMVQLVETDQGYEATPLHGKSGLITLMSAASGFVHINRTQEGLLEGSEVNVQLVSSQLIVRG